MEADDDARHPADLAAADRRRHAARPRAAVRQPGLRAGAGRAACAPGSATPATTGATTPSSAPAAFAGCGGLPELPGKPPFGGLILSHDFVEAAFIRRGGWAVRMADDLDGQLRARAAEPDRARGARPALVPGQPAAHPASRHRRPASVEPAASLHGRDVLSRLAALAAVPALRHGAGAARLPGAAGLFPRPLVAVPRLAAHRPRARHGALRHLHAGALRAEAPRHRRLPARAATPRGLRLRADLRRARRAGAVARSSRRS